jgi:hypothetical protein
MPKKHFACQPKRSAPHLLGKVERAFLRELLATPARRARQYERGERVSAKAEWPPLVVD